MKRKQNKKQENSSVNRHFEEFLKYYNNEYKDYKKFRDLINSFLKKKVEKAHVSKEYEEAKELALSVIWSLYIDFVFKYVDVLHKKEYIPVMISPKQKVLFHPLFKNSNTGMPLSYEEDLDLILTKWEDGIIDYNVAADMCEGIIMDIYCCSISDSQNNKTADIKKLYKVLMIKVAGAAFNKVFKAFYKQDSFMEELTRDKNHHFDLPFLFIHTLKSAVFFLFKYFHYVLVEDFQILSVLNNKDRDYYNLLFTYINTYITEDVALE